MTQPARTIEIDGIPRLAFEGNTSPLLGPAQVTDLVTATTRIAKLALLLSNTPDTPLMKPRSRDVDPDTMPIAIRQLTYRNPFDITWALTDPSFYNTAVLASGIFGNIVAVATMLVTSLPKGQAGSSSTPAISDVDKVVAIADQKQPGFSTGRRDYLARRASDIIIVNRHVTGSHVLARNPKQGP